MRIFAFILLFSISSLVFSEDCTWSKQAQIERLQEILKLNPGGSLDLKTQTIVWSQNNSPEVSFAHKGCVDLGSVAKKKITPNENLTEQQIFSASLVLANKFFTPFQAEPLKNGISSKKFELHKEGNVTQYIFEAPLDSYLYIEYNKSQGYLSVNFVEN
jgi:hypothetical protein